MSLQQRLQRARAEISGDLIDPVTGMMFPSILPMVDCNITDFAKKAIRYDIKAMSRKEHSKHYDIIGKACTCFMEGVRCGDCLYCRNEFINTFR